MNKRKERINAKLIKLGKSLELDNLDTIKAKRTIRNVITMALFAGALIILGSIMMPGGPAGLYYTAVSIKDFRILFGGLF
jgi:hypothetical protein